MMEVTTKTRIGAGALTGVLVAGGWFMASADVSTLNSGLRLNTIPLSQAPNAESTQLADLLATATAERSSGDLQGAIQALESATALAPEDASVLEALAASYAQHAEAPHVAAAERRRLIESGLVHVERAIAIDSGHIGSLITKSLLLRSLSRLAAEPERSLLLEQADTARELALRTSTAAPVVRGVEVPDVSGPPPPPPPPPPGGVHDDIVWTYGSVEYAVSGPVHLLEKVKDARPIYPPMMIRAGISGTVVLEGVIDRNGYVRKMVVVEAPSLLHHTTIDAVRQWQFDPQVVAAAAAPISIRVTATFPAER